MSHKPAMLKEVLEYLAPVANGTYIDCTFGAGGYTEGILKTQSSRVIAIDIDESVEKIADGFKSKYSQRFKFHNRNYSELETFIDQQVDGIVLDLGVSSMQLDNAVRGFSFNRDALLDMRMSNSLPLTAMDVVNNKSEEELAYIIYNYANEKNARKIARSIAHYRKLDKITTTLQLAKIIENLAQKTNFKIHPATKTFQAIRIYVNDELGALTKVLYSGMNILKPHGRLVVVSFHSGEDKIVKNFFKDNTKPRIKKSKYNNTSTEENKYSFISLTKKPISPSQLEIKNNIRARSAKLRAGIKINKEV